MRLILLAAAVLPALWLLVKVYRADRLEPEPPGLILSLVALGIFSTFPAILTEQIGANVLGHFFSAPLPVYYALYYFLVVALSEEGFKYLLLKSRTWISPHFNCQFDGVVYAVSVSLGFALWENILYVMRYGLAIAAARAVTAVPGHACFGIFMGVWYGAAKRMALAGQKKRSRIFRIIAVMLPVFLHGTYDYIAFQTQSFPILLFFAFVVLFFLVTYAVVKQAATDDVYIS